MFKPFFIILIILASNALATESSSLSHNFKTIKHVTPAPALKLYDMDEEIIDIKSLRGKVVVVNFWATWCPPCREEMPSLEKLYQATKDKNIEILAINVGENIDDVFSFINSIEPSPSFPILFDTEAKAMEQWKVQGLPTTYIIDTQGRITYKAVGGRQFDHPDIIQKLIQMTP